MHETQIEIIEVIRNNPRVTVRQIQEKLRISSPSVVQHHLNALKKLGIVKKVDIWVIFEKNE